MPKIGTSSTCRGVGPLQALADIEDVGDHEDREDRRLADDKADTCRRARAKAGATSSRVCRPSRFVEWRSSFILPVRIFRMLQIPQRPAAVHPGIFAKLYAGGGEVVAHSSVHASHGSLPAGLPLQVRTDSCTRRSAPRCA